MKVLKKYRLRHDITEKRHVGDFGLMPEAGGFYRSYYRRSSLSEPRDRDEQGDYLQVNDKVYGPYQSTHGQQFRREGRHSFNYKRKVYPDRACIATAGVCCSPLTLFPGCVKLFAYSPPGAMYEYMFDEHKGVFRNKGIGDFVMVNGKSYGPYDDVQSVNFSRTGESFAFKYVEKGKDYFVFNNKTFGPKCSQYGSEIVMSDDGTRYAYHYPSEIGPEGFGYVVLDGKELGKFRYAKMFSFSRDGNEFAFIHDKGEWTISGHVGYPGQWTLWRNGTETPVNPDTFHGSKYPILTHGASEEMFIRGSIEKRRNGYYVQRDGRQWGPYDKVGQLVSGDDGKNFGFNYTRNDDDYVYVNGRNYGPYDEAKTPFVARKGPAYGFSFKKDDKKYYFINGKNYGPFHEPGLTTSENMESFVITYRCKGGICVLIKGREYGPYDVDDMTLRITPDISRWGIVYKKHVGLWLEGYYNCYIRIMDKVFGPYQAADLRFINGDRAIAGFIKDGYVYVAEIK